MFSLGRGRHRFFNSETKSSMNKRDVADIKDVDKDDAQEASNLALRHFYFPLLFYFMLVRSMTP